MYLDYSKLEFDAYGRPEVPELMLQTLNERSIGLLSGVNNLKFNIKLSEPSEISFDIPSVVKGKPNPLYHKVEGRKLIYTKNYGVYVTMKPSKSSDGISDIKSVKGYSIEKRLEDKRFFLEEGTFNFYSPMSGADTVLSRILEIAKGWKIGYVSATLWNRYRTFDQYDDYLLSFIYNTAPEKYRCVFVFDPYEKTINVYDADEERTALPIYLDFDNLLEEIEVEELSDELVTALRPYGADELDIRSVNPTGSNWIYNIDHFVSNGDIPESIAAKWSKWQKAVDSQRSAYSGYCALRASATSRLLTLKAELTDLKGELTNLTNQQSVIIQAIAMETTEKGKETQQTNLATVNDKISAQTALVEAKEVEIAEAEGTVNSYAVKTNSIAESLNIETYFSEDELNILREYFVEQDVTESTFVATDLNTVTSGQTAYIEPSAKGTMLYFYKKGAEDDVEAGKIELVDLPDDVDREMFTISGCTFRIYNCDKVELSCDVVKGVLDRKTGSNEFVLSIYASNIQLGDARLSSGLITFAGKGTTSDPRANSWSVTISQTTTMYITTNASEFQKYSVQSELLEYAQGVLNDLSVYTYEFSVSSGNFLFSKEFEPFRNKLELGRGIYLKLSDEQTITPLLIEMEFEFEKQDSFSLVFSNRFKRHDNVNSLKDMLEKGYSSGRSFDASKYLYNQSLGEVSAITEFMNSSLDAAKNAILGASNQQVRIDGSGISIGVDEEAVRELAGNSVADKLKDCELRLTNGMIAMSDNGWNSAKLAIGKFVSDEVGEYFGVNADVIGGKLLIGNNLIVENMNDDGVMQFRVDSSGAWLRDSTFVLQSTKTNGGEIIIDPKYGIVAGNKNLYNLNGTNVVPSFYSNGTITKDADGMPKNSNFYLDIDSGNAYFRGTVYATSGKFTGEIQASSGTFSGTVKGAQFQTSSGKPMTNSSGQFLLEYLDTVELSNGITEEYTAAIDSSAKGLTAQYTQAITNSANKIKEEYTAAISASAQELSTRLKAVEDDYITSSELTQTASGIESRVETIEGNYVTSSTLTQTSNEIKAIVQGVTGSDGKVTAASIVASINDGTSKINMSATNIDLSGYVTISNLEGNSTTKINGASIESGQIKIGGTSSSPNFQVDKYGNVYMRGSITIDWDNVDERGSAAYDLADEAWDKADDAEDAADAAVESVDALANGEYEGGTFINGDCIYSPKFVATLDDAGDPLTYAEYSGQYMSFWEDGYEKLVMDYGSEYSYEGSRQREYVALKLGNSNRAYIMKKYESSDSWLWIGNEDQTCGILFNFDEQQYRIFGSLNNSLGG